MLAQLLKCSPQSLPLKHYRLPLQDHQLCRAEAEPLIGKMDQCLACWKGQLLSSGCPLVLLQSVLSAIPTCYMSFFWLPDWVIHCLDAIRRHFSWCGSDDMISSFDAIPTYYIEDYWASLPLLVGDYRSSLSSTPYHRFAWLHEITLDCLETEAGAKEHMEFGTLLSWLLIGSVHREELQQFLR